MVIIRLFQVFSIVLVCGSLKQSVAGDVDAWETLQGGDYSSVEAVWLPRAERGEVEAQLFMGHLESIRDKHTKAAQWYWRAAIKGNASAQALLANQYLSGNGVAADTVRAYAWYDLAASQGHLNAIRARDVIAGQMSEGQLRQAKTLTETWKRDGPTQEIE